MKSTKPPFYHSFSLEQFFLQYAPNEYLQAYKKANKLIIEKLKKKGGENS